jgi:hypothetical protein
MTGSPDLTESVFAAVAPADPAERGCLSGPAWGVWPVIEGRRKRTSTIPATN